MAVAHVTVAAHEPLQPERQGVWRRELVDTPFVKVVEWFFDAGVESKPHGHDVDQAAYHVAGKFELVMGGTTTTVVTGDAYAIPAGSAHGLRCIEKGSYILTTIRSDAAEAAGRSHDQHAHGDDHGHDHGNGHKH